MEIDAILTAEERASLTLRAIYAESGYEPYKMSKFEPYDLYAANKDFLSGEHIITFTDISGRLMALKPDVTLSIIKNTEIAPGETKKLYYNETVYRVPKGAPGFRELTQVGLECIGEPDAASVAEVIRLACRSLLAISKDAVLDLSHFGLIADTINKAGLSGAAAQAAITCLNEKNVHGLFAVCDENGVPAQSRARLEALLKLYGAPQTVLPQIEAVFGENIYVRELAAAANAAGSDMLRVDFSVPANIKYYNGIVFKGYVKGLPDYVLSGGQYDPLMKRMKKNCRALGFAVYLDALQQLKGEACPMELLDLNTGVCRMAVAAKDGFTDDVRKTLRVATKFSNIAAAHYAARGRDIDIIHLNGSIELAPILGLSDVIVDIVETGTTLKENHLSVIETIVPISARLIANKANFKFKSERIETLVAALRARMGAKQ